MSDSPQYPLGESSRDRITAASGRTLSDITLESVAKGDLTSADLQIQADTLRAQAHVAQQAGYTQLSQNLLRAAELTAVPNEELLRMYETLRPGRATYSEMIALAERLETIYLASQNARLVREAAQVYLSRSLARKS